MNALTFFKLFRIRTLAPLALALAAASLPAATLPFPSPTTVLSTDLTSGPSFLVASALTGADMIDLTASGLVCLQTGGTFCTNAAGVVVIAGTSPVGASLPNGATTFGSLLLGNTTLGFVQVFATNAANGLGSATPPSTLMITTTLSALGFAGGIPGGSTLEWRVSDTIATDNSGMFTLTNNAASVPEPSTILLLGLGLVAVGISRRRKS